MTLIIYGSSRSRTMRVLLTAAELSITFKHVPLASDDPALKRPDFLRLNPADTIPTTVDDGFALSDSQAISPYLSKKYGADRPSFLYPATLEDEAQAHLEPWLQQDNALKGL